jgi:putative phosphoribosyl transferase
MLTGFTINGDRALSAELNAPAKPTGVVIFAHESGSSLNSIRNQVIAQILRDYGFATLLVELLTHEEQESDERTQRIACRLPGIKLNKFNIELLTDRLIGITREIQSSAITKDLNIVYFGSSTGAAAALFAAADFRSVKALIARGGRTDLVVKNTLLDVTCPCLFIAASNDKMVIQANKKTIIELASVKDKRLEIIKDASHLFEEHGKIEEVGVIAGRWLVERL